MKYLVPILAGITLTLLGGVFTAIAAETIVEYTPLAPLPGTLTPGTETTNLPTYLAGMMKLLIAVAGSLAFLMMVIGGTEYVAAGITPDAKGHAKEKITNAIIGLILTLVSYLILLSINPRLVEFNLELPAIVPNSKTIIEDIVVVEQPTPATGDAGCSSCVALGQSIPQKDGACKAYVCHASSLIVGKLAGLAGDLTAQNLNWQVTEAWPPTRTHVAKCQNPDNSETGKCVDASLLSNKTPENINIFIEASKKRGLRAVYEVDSEARRQQLVSSGVATTNIIFVANITGEHFSVYNN